MSCATPAWDDCTAEVAASGSGGGTNGRSCWQIVPASGSVSVSICATTAVSTQVGEPLRYAVCPSPTIVRKRTLPSCVARRLAPRNGVAGSYGADDPRDRDDV